MFNLKTKRLSFALLTLLVLAACNDLSSTIPISSLSSSASTSLSISTSGVTSSSSSAPSSSMSSESSSTPSSSNELPSEEQYQIFLLAQQSGYTGTYQEWLDSIKGADGASLLSGTSNPTSTLGKNGDTYINTSTWDVYVKSGGNWTKVGNVMGPKGDKGDPGEDGLTPYIGTNGNWWIGDTDTGVSASGTTSDLINSQTFTVTFDSNGGTPVPSQQVKRLDKVTKPSDPTKNGYTFDGWYIGDERWVFSGYNVTENITLTARWNDEELGTEGLVYSQYVRDGKVEYLVSDYMGNDKDVIVPPNVNGYEVTAIGTSAFLSSKINSVAFSDKLKSIGNYAFADNQLSSVTIPNSVTKIGNMAFESNLQLKSVTIPNGVTSIGERAFSATAITLVVIPNSVNVIGQWAFYSEQTISVYAEATQRPNGWHPDTTNYSITFGYISHGEVGGFGYVVSLINNEPVLTITSSINTGSVVIPSMIDGYPVSRIGENAFQGKNIAAVTIPNSVTMIGEYAFANNQLTSVTIPSSVTKIGYASFAGNQLTSLIMSDSVMTIEGYAFSYNQFTSLTIPNGVTKIDTGAFIHNQLTSVTIPNSVTTIGLAAFADNQLTSVTIPNSVSNIGYGSFAHNPLTSVTIPNSVTSIGDFAFLSYQNLTIYVEAAVKPMGWSQYWNSSENSTTVIWDYKNQQ